MSRLLPLLLSASAREADLAPESERPPTTPASSGGFAFDEEGVEDEDDLIDPGTIEIPSEIKTQDDALRAIKALCEHARAGNGKWRDQDQALSDLRAATQALSARSAPGLEGGGDRELKARYMEGNRLRLIGSSDQDGRGNDIGGFVPGLLDDAPVNELQRDLQRWVQRRNLVRQFQRLAGAGRPHTPHCDAMIARLGRALPPEMARAFADASGAGAEWIPDQVLPMIEREVQHQYQVAGLFDEVVSDRETVKLPFLSAGFIPYLIGEVGGDDPAQVPGSTMSTTDRTINIKTFGARAQVGDNAAEDAILPVIDSIIAPELVRALVIGEEDAIINGDTTSTHADTALATWNPDSIYPSAPGGGSNDHRRAFIGLRHRAGDVSNTTDRSTFSSTTLRTDLGTVKGPKQGPGSKVIIASGKAILALMGFSEMITLEKYGPNASFLSGEAGKVFGVRVIESQVLTEDLNASGVYDGVTTTKTGLLIVNTSRFKRFSRRGVRLRQQADITRGIVHLVADRRGSFATIDGSSTKNVHYAYNMS